MTSESFSQRFGYEKPPLDLSEDEMPASLRAGLWDAIRLYFMSSIETGGYWNKNFSVLCNSIWFNFLRVPLDSRPKYPPDARAKIRLFILSDFSFHKVYSFLEFLVEYADGDAKGFTDFCSKVLERERSAFRFAGSQLVKISDEESLIEVESAMVSASNGVQIHISTAAKHYSNSPPDYRNSIKESISAVEAAVFFLLGEKHGRLGHALKILSDQYDLHEAMRLGFEKLYGYTSDKDGIRHAILEEEEITQGDARYMLVSCSAFANYLVGLKAE